MHQGHVKTQGEGGFFLLGLPSLWDHEKQTPLWSSWRVHSLCSSHTQSHMPRMHPLQPSSASGTHFPLPAVQLWTGSRSSHLPHILHAETTPLPETPSPTQPSLQPTAPEGKNSMSSKVDNSASFSSRLREGAQYTPTEPQRETSNSHLTSIPPCPGLLAAIFFWK